MSESRRLGGQACRAAPLALPARCEAVQGSAGQCDAATAEPLLLFLAAPPGRACYTARERRGGAGALLSSKYERMARDSSGSLSYPNQLMHGGPWPGRSTRGPGNPQALGSDGVDLAGDLMVWVSSLPHPSPPHPSRFWSASSPSAGWGPSADTQTKGASACHRN